MRHRERANSGLTRIALLAAVLVSSFLISIGRASVDTPSRAQIATQETVTPLAAALAIPLRGVENFFASLKDRSNAFEENKELRVEIATLRQKQARYDNLAMKVARYEAILGVDTKTDIPLKKIAARAVGETNGPFVRSLLLSVGTDDGVAVGNPVMSTRGLVGHIINTGPDSARVLRLSDLNSRIAVASARSDATAILAGDNTALPKLSFVNQREAWAVGDRVISSGDDGAMPRGLAVGDVVADGDGELRVRLYSQDAKLDWLWVSPYQQPIAPSEDEPEAEAEITAEAGERP